MSIDSDYLASFAAIEERHWWFRARREIVLDFVRTYAPHDAMTLLDVGCGTGGGLAHLAEGMPELDCRGLEPDPRARSACEALGLTVSDGDAADLGVEDGSVDVIVALDVLEHVPDHASAARAIARALSPGGVAVVTVPALRFLWGPHDEINHHLRRYSRDELVDVLESSGLEVERVTYFDTFLFPIAAAVRLLERATRIRSESERVPAAPVNQLLYRTFAAERGWLARRSFPIGVSLLAVVRKRGV